MYAISIRQPWPGAILNGWKPVENRGRMLAPRGLVLIHAGQRLDDDFTSAQRLIHDQTGHDVPVLGTPGQSPAWGLGGIVGVAELHSAHRGCDGSCAPGWAYPGQVHHMLRNARPLRQVVPCPGRLYPWIPDPEVLDIVKDVWPR